MRFSQALINTVREVPAEAEIISHQLMLRTGMIKKLAAGIYSYLPLGYRVIRKIERIIRQEMDLAGAQEVYLPVLCPSEIWQESGRWSLYGPELMRLKDHLCVPVPNALQTSHIVLFNCCQLLFYQ